MSSSALTPAATLASPADKAAAAAGTTASSTAAAAPLRLGLAMQPNPAADVVFFDLETTITRHSGERQKMLEFAAVVLGRESLREREVYSTLVKPADLRTITERTTAYNGISAATVRDAPPFAEVADRVRELLDGRVWAGHNIVSFDDPVLAEHFLAAGVAPPRAAGFLDTLQLCERRFGRRRTADLKLATLGAFFGHGDEKHRALADVRMNIAVFRDVAAAVELDQWLDGADASRPAPAARASGRRRMSEPTVLLRRAPTPRRRAFGASGAQGYARASSYSVAGAVRDGSGAARLASPPSTPESVRQTAGFVALLDAAIKGKSSVFVAYRGGRSPSAQKRELRPLRWKTEDKEQLEVHLVSKSGQLSDKRYTYIVRRMSDVATVADKSA